ncbi:MAG: hypothetical protein QM767_21465 [Anaeromyxobacter sp.]
MLLSLRIYLYGACLWGLLCLPGAGLGPAAPAILAVIDAMPLLLLAVSLASWRAWERTRLSLLQLLGIALLAGLAVANVAVTALSSGSVLDGVKYLAALARPLTLLAALGLHRAASDASGEDRAVYRSVLLRDLRVIVVVHFAAAAVQRVFPGVGERLIPLVSETQSGLAALAEHDVSGFFPNSIDFSYLTVAAYLVLHAERMFVERRRPPLWSTVVFGAFAAASGSDASVVCFAMVVAAGWLAPLPTAKRRRMAGGAAVLGALVAAATAGIWQGALLLKIDNMMLSRFGLLFVSTPLMIAEHPGVLLTGLGGDFHVIEAAIKALPQVPLVFTYDDVTQVINDVFWVGLMLSLGAPLALAYVLSWRSLFNGACSLPTASRAISPASVVLAIVIFAGFFNQILLVRSFYSALCVGLFALRYAPRPCGDQVAEVTS